MDAAEFDYDLPDSSIAQTPVEPRDAARLLVDRGPGAEPAHRHVADLPSLVGPGDLVVVNDTKVINARLRLTKPTGGRVEVLLVEPVPPLPSDTWEALVRPSRRVPPGTELRGIGLKVVVGDDLGGGRRLVRLDQHYQIEVEDAIEINGVVPLPPYIHRELSDPDRYQTVFSEGDDRWWRLSAAEVDLLRSVAAPTAGLHITSALWEGMVDAGAEVAVVRLAVGLDTFRPMTTKRVEDHHMHSERFSVSSDVLDACRRADRVIAVGTTVVRALESAASNVGQDGRTDLFIHGDYEFQVVDAMLTNFHVPRSTLLVMVEAFVGPRWRRLYQTALEEGYRFLSFGDAMLLQHQRGN